MAIGGLLLVDANKLARSTETDRHAKFVAAATSARSRLVACLVDHRGFSHLRPLSEERSTAPIALGAEPTGAFLAESCMSALGGVACNS